MVCNLLFEKPLANPFLYIVQSIWLILGHICNKMFSSSQYAILARYLVCLFEKCLIWSLESLGIWLGSCGKLFLTFFWETVVYIFFKVIDLSLVFFLIWHLLYWEEVWYIYWTMFIIRFLKVLCLDQGIVANCLIYLLAKSFLYFFQSD